MFTFVFTLHILLCIFLVIVVLLQQGKGADLGAAFSGSSSSLFGAAGASSILVKVTTSAAILFMCTSVALIKLYQEVTPSVTVSDSLLKGSVMEKQQPASAATSSGTDTPGTVPDGNAVNGTASGLVTAPSEPIQESSVAVEGGTGDVGTASKDQS